MTNPHDPLPDSAHLSPPATMAPVAVTGCPFGDFRARAVEAFTLADGTLAKGSGLAGDLYGSFFRTGGVDWNATGLSPRARQVWQQAFRWEPAVQVLAVHRDSDGADDRSAARCGGPADSRDFDPGQTAKAVLELEDGLKVEMVYIPVEGREGRAGSLCVSTQVGCAMGCIFCETGTMGLQRDLSASEIVSQVLAARFALGWNFRNIVYMGMGEPLDNLSGTLGSLDVLLDPRGFSFAQEQITLCTLGIPAGLEALGSKGWKRMNLSLSLHGATREKRASLMPASCVWPLDDLLALLADWKPRPTFVLALNWCLLPGINDGIEDADAIAAIAARLGRVMVNLIPYNPGSHPVAPQPEPEAVEAFLALLTARGVPSRIRGPRGRSVMAACGQLGGLKASS